MSVNWLQVLYVFLWWLGFYLGMRVERMRWEDRLKFANWFESYQQQEWRAKRGKL